MIEFARLLILLGLGAALLYAGVVFTVVRIAMRPPIRTEAIAIARGLPVTPDDLGLDWEAWDVRRPDGRVLPAWTIETGGGGPDGGTVVLAHGWFRCARDLLPRLGSWRSRFARVVVFDARGHGDADGPCTLGVREVADLVAVAEACGAESGTVVAAGWSMGGRTVLEAVATRPDVFAGAVAIAPVIDFEQALAFRVREQGLPAAVVVPGARAVLRMRGAWPTTDPLAAGPRSDGPPVTIVQGARDLVCPPGLARSYAEGIGAELVEIEPAAHDTPEFHDPDAFEDALDRLLARA